MFEEEYRRFLSVGADCNRRVTATAFMCSRVDVLTAVVSGQWLVVRVKSEW